MAVENPAAMTVVGRASPQQGAAESPSVVSRLLEIMKRDPVLFVTLGYVSISFIGLWGSWWFYRGLGLPILSYLQAGDFLVAGLREPAYAFGLIQIFVISWLLLWPERWRRRHPERVAVLRKRWWGPIVFPPERGLYSWWGMRPDTGLVVCVVLGMLTMVAMFSTRRAEAVRAGRGQPVEVTLADAGKPLEGPTRLLGTSTGFAFLYWPETQRVEAVTLQSIARIRALPKPPRGSGIRR